MTMHFKQKYVIFCTYESRYVNCIKFWRRSQSGYLFLHILRHFSLSYTAGFILIEPITVGLHPALFVVIQQIHWQLTSLVVAEA